MQLLRETPRKVTWRALRRGACCAFLLLLTACGVLLLTDRPGLVAKYFALGPPWKGVPLIQIVEAPSLDPAQDRERLMTRVLYSVRWRGWWDVAQGGEHQFSLEADDVAYLRINGQLMVEVSTPEGRPTASGRAVLAPGFNKVEVGFVQGYGDARMALRWTAPGASAGSATALPLADLYSKEPLALRRFLRGVGANWPRTFRQLLGALLLFTGLSLLGGFLSRAVEGTDRLRARLPAIDRPGVRLALLSALFVIVFLAVFPYTGPVRGGDDTGYLMAVKFNQKSHVSRYVHVYLLKLFTTLSGGDPLVGVRVWWSFVMAATVSGLAVAVRSVGPGLQVRTLAAILFMLLSQPIIWGLIGGGFADFSAMMFVTLATATCMHGIVRDRERPPPRHEWHALVIGALTVGAIRSKEVGAVLFLLPALFVIGEGATLELRRFARKMVYWIAGAVAALLALMFLDGWILGNPFFSMNLRRLREMNFPAGVRVGLRSLNWFDKIWHGEQMRFLWIGVVAAAVVAGARRRELRLRLLHLLPVAYMLALIALYVRLPHPFSNRMLIPIVPLACLMSGLLLHYAGLDDIPWRKLVRPALLIPTGMAAALVFLVVVPLQRGTLEAAALLPVDLLLRYGWKPESFVVGVLLPASALVAFGVVALVAGRRPPRMAALLVTYLLAYGLGFEFVTSDLARKASVQKGELLLYPWRTFREELNSLPANEIALSLDLRGRYQMTAATEGAIAELALGRNHVRVNVSTRLPANAQTAIASRESYHDWLREMPALAETATFGPSGFLVLVRPREAGGGTSGASAEPPTTEPEGSSEAEEIEERPTSGGAADEDEG